MLCLTYLATNSAKNRFLITNDLKSVGIGNYLMDFCLQPRHSSLEMYLFFVSLSYFDNP